MKLILLGAPGAGKGTQGEIISEKYSIPVISTGNIIRSALKQRTEMGLKAESYISSGALVPDDVIIGILKERLAESDCKNGFIFDGVPRTVAQAEALRGMNIDIDMVISIEVSDSAIIKRMSGRRVCGSCGSSYHIDYNPPAKEGVCDKCAGELIIRDDDKPETVEKRLAVYHELTEPLTEYYRKAGLLKTVEGQNSVEDISKRIFELLEELR